MVAQIQEALASSSLVDGNRLASSSLVDLLVEIRLIILDFCS
jgi:hypothetical protein